MAKGGAEQVIPFLIGIVLFAFIMAFIISSFGPVAPYTERNAVPAQYDLSQEYDMYSPTYDVSWVTNGTLYWQTSRALQFTHSGVSPVYSHIIRGNVEYVSGSTQPWRQSKDCIITDFNYKSSTPFAMYVLPYATISAVMNSTESNITYHDFYLYAVTSGTSGNYTLIVEVDHLANKTADLYANNYKLTLVAPHELNTVSFWTALGYLLTFDANWIPTYPLVAQMLSAIIIFGIVLCVIRMVW